MAQGARVARASGRPTVAVVRSGQRGEGASRPLSPPPRNRLLRRPGRRRPVLARTGPPAPVSRAARWQSAEPTANFGRRGDSGLGSAVAQARRGEARRAPSQVGGPGRAPRLPRPGLHSDFSGSPGACQLAGELREGFCWTLVLRETSFVGFWALAESSKYTKTSSESLGAISVNLHSPPLSLLYTDAGIGDFLVFWS